MPDYVESPPGSITDHTKKADYDICFDNTVRVKDEFDEQHTSTGKHNGIQVARTSAAVAGPVSASNRLTVAKSTFLGGLWKLVVLVTDNTNGNFFAAVILREKLAKLDVYFAPKGATAGGRQYGDSAITSSAPGAGTFIRVYLDGDNIKVDLTNDSASSSIWITYHRLSNLGV